MTQATPYFVPPEPGRWRAWLLAVVVHAGLLAFLWFGVHWQNQIPVAVEAEIWTPPPREIAPPPPAPPIEKSAEPAPAVIQPHPIDPDIALRAEKKRQAKRARAEEDRRAAQAKADELARKKQAADTLKKVAREEKRQHDLQEQAKEQAARDRTRAEDLKRLLAQAGAGEAPPSQGSRGNAEYASRVGAKIRANTVFNAPANLAENPAVEYAINLLPDGSLRHPISKLKSSGIPNFDEAVLHAIEKSQPFPPDKSGSVPSRFTLVHRLKDQ